MIIAPSNRVIGVETYYFARKLAEIAQLELQGIKVINLGIGSPDMAPPTSVISKLHEVANEDPTAHQYQSYRGLWELRNAFANYYKNQYGIELNPETEILPLIGSKEGVMHICMSFLNQGDKVLIPNPGYPTYRSACTLTGATIVDYELDPCNDWQPNFDQLDNMDWGGIKMMWVNYPNMPTGAKAQKETFHRLVELAIQRKILICHDNPYSHILNDNPMSILSITGAKEVCIELNSLSKSHNMAGWRVGAMFGKKEYLDTVLRFKSNMDSGMFKAVQLAAKEALGVGDDWFVSLNEEYAKRRVIACTIFDTLACKYESTQVGLFVWAKSPITDTESLVDWLIENAGVFITPGHIFGSKGQGYLRISLCSQQSVLQLALNNIKREIQNYNLFISNSFDSKILNTLS